MNFLKSMGFLLVGFFVFPSFAEPIKDNSFLLEEAYNQDPGTVQFILMSQYNKRNADENTLSSSFTNELPLFGQAHQLSYTIPYATNKQSSGTTSGVGDVLLNYRYQLLDTEKVAMAPRLSLVLPTGKRENGLGTGALGAQFNLAASVLLSEKWVNHWNMGYTLTPNAKGQTGDEAATTLSTNFGTSFAYLQNDHFNWLVEFVHNSTEVSNGDKTKTRTESYYVNPGFRCAIDIGDAQIVPGLSAPIGIGPSETEEYSVLAYFSVESKFW